MNHGLQNQIESANLTDSTVDQLIFWSESFPKTIWPIKQVETDMTKIDKNQMELKNWFDF